MDMKKIHYRNIRKFCIFLEVFLSWNRPFGWSRSRKKQAAPAPAQYPYRYGKC